MQMITLASSQATTAAFTGSAVSYRPVAGYTSVFVAELKRGSATGGTTTTSVDIALQGSLDGTDWVTIDTFKVSAMILSLGTTDYNATGGYRSYVKVVQGFPLMRVVTSGAVNTTADTLFLTAHVANG